MRARVLYITIAATTAAACESPRAICDVALDVCRKAEDLAYIASAQLGDETATGNAIIGDAGALQAPGKVSVAVRVSGVRRASPIVSGTVLANGGAQGSAFGVERGTATALSIDVAAGALPGFRVGESRVGSVDILLGASPSIARDRGDIRVKAGGVRTALSAGLRVGLLSDAGASPALSLTGIARVLPPYELTLAPMQTSDGGTARIQMDTVAISTVGVRLAASKRFGRLGLTGGLGRDRYRSRVSYNVFVDGPNGSGEYGQTRTVFKISRNTAFAGATWAVSPRAAVSAELGRVFGGPTSPTINTLGSQPANAARGFLTVGMTLRTGRTVGQD